MLNGYTVYQAYDTISRGVWPHRSRDVHKIQNKVFYMQLHSVISMTKTIAGSIIANYVSIML